MVSVAFSMSCAADPFQPRVEGVFAGKDIGAGQAHERSREPSVPPRIELDRLQAGAADRFDRIIDGLGVASITCFMLRYCCLTSRRRSSAESPSLRP